MNSYLIQNVKFTRVSNSAAAAQTAINGTPVDMAGYDGVIFVALLGTVTDGSVLTLTADQNTANSTTVPTPTSTGVATTPLTAATSSNGALIVDVYRPVQRYLFPNLTRTAQNAAIDGIIAIQYNARSKPTVQDITTILASQFGIGA